MAIQTRELRIDTGSVAQGDVEDLRALEYGLLARLLARSPDAETLTLAGRLVGDESDLGRAHGALAEAARSAAPEAVSREYFDLFVGVGRGELLPYASYYLTGFLNERPLAAVRRDLRVLGLERAEGLHDSEDHVAILFDVMAAVAAGHAGTVSLGDRVFFQRHLEPWVPRFFDDLARAEAASFYRAVAAVGAAFMTIESQAFELGQAMA
jgi:TorA maturation chaperone TorD